MQYWFLKNTFRCQKIRVVYAQRYTHLFFWMNKIMTTMVRSLKFVTKPFRIHWCQNLVQILSKWVKKIHFHYEKDITLRVQVTVLFSLFPYGRETIHLPQNIFSWNFQRVLLLHCFHRCLCSTLPICSRLFFYIFSLKNTDKGTRGEKQCYCKEMFLNLNY